jgi:hypothetical protein
LRQAQASSLASETQALHSATRSQAETVRSIEAALREQRDDMVQLSSARRSFDFYCLFVFSFAVVC